MKSSLLLVAGGGLFLVLVLMALLAPVLSTISPQEMNLALQNQGPSLAHPFGLDSNGADVFSAVIYGARVSLLVAFVVVSLSVIVGLLIGSIAGYWGGWIDEAIMRFLDMLYAFPGFLLAMAIMVVMEPSIWNLIFAMSVTGWAGYARLVRGEFLHLMKCEHVIAAQALGVGPLRRVVLHIWPNLLGPLIVQASFGMAATVIAESALSFLGLGAPPEVPTWGRLLYEGQAHLEEAPHISLFPGLAVMLLVLAFNLLGDGLRDYLDPHSSP